MKPVLVGLGLTLALAACSERLTIPVECPAQCPGGAPVIRDTVIEALANADSSFVGYVGHNDVPGLILTNGSAAGTAYAVVGFDELPETLLLAGVEYQYVLDSVEISLGLVTRDTLATDIRFLLYRLPVNTDSTVTFEELEALFTEQALVDTIAVADTVLFGRVTITLHEDDLEKLAFGPDDDRRLTFGIKLEADTATGVRIGSRLTDGYQPSLVNYVTVEELEGPAANQFYAPPPLFSSNIRDTEVVNDPDLLVVGGLPAFRSIIRFALPEEVERSGAVIRATLELTPARPFYDLANSPTDLDVRMVVTDLGYRSIPIPGGASSVRLPVSGQAVVPVEIATIVNFWRTQPQIPQLLYLSLTPEGHAFSEPVFYSTRSETGRPRLRLTYAVSGQLEVP